MAVQIRESKHPYDNNTNFEVGRLPAIVIRISEFLMPCLRLQAILLVFEISFTALRVASFPLLRTRCTSLEPSTFR